MRACLRKEKGYNPDAPKIILAGDGIYIRSSAVKLCEQAGAIPVFIKHASNQWKYMGEGKVRNWDESPKEIARQNRRAERDDVSRVIYMHPWARG